jgi:hypothetical protein
MVLIGGPTTEVVSRAVYGYAADYRTRSIHYLGGVVNLPFVWRTDANHVHCVVRSSSDMPEHQQSPAWHLIDQSTRPATVWYPEVTTGGILEQDFLLITSTPAYYSRTAVERGKRLISIAGCHGAGTRAAVRLLSRPDLRGGLLEAARESHAFQALYRCHLRPTSGGPLPLAVTGLEMIGFRNIPWDLTVTLKAEAGFKAFYPRWFQSLPA